MCWHDVEYIGEEVRALDEGCVELFYFIFGASVSSYTHQPRLIDLGVGTCMLS